MASTKIDQHTRQVVALLGGPRVFERRIRTPRELKAALRSGFPYAAFESVSSALHFSAAGLAELLGVASRTLARRKASQVLSPIESDRLYRIVRLLLQASHVLGSIEKARTWLNRENQALTGETPISLLDTEIGERQVEELLDRLNYGIHS